MSARIVDTNAWVVASDLSSPTRGCLETCVNWLVGFRDSNDHLVVDSASFESGGVPGNSVLQELRQNLSEGTFGRDLLNRHFMAKFLFDLIDLEYDESGAMIPAEIVLRGFEPADRKWVALHLGHPDRPPIFNAYDGDWIKCEEDLQTAGIIVEHLCEAELRDLVAAREDQ